jgi:hypothetical protein
MRKLIFKKILIRAVTVVALMAFYAAPGLAADKSNIVVIMGDDKGTRQEILGKGRFDLAL